MSVQRTAGRTKCSLRAPSSRRQWLAFALLSGVAACDSHGETVEELRLEEVRAVALPTDLDITGAALAANGALVAWSQSQGVVVANKGAGWFLVCAHRAIEPIAAAFRPDGGLEIVDGHGTILEGTGDQCSAGARLPAGAVISSAVLADSTWILSLRTSNASSALVKLAKDGRVEPIPGADAADAPNSDPLAIVLRAGHGFVTQGSLHPPFAWRIVMVSAAPDGERSPRPHGLVRPSLDEASGKDLLGLGVHMLDRGYLQVLADPRSDNRLLIRYDAAGRQVATRSLALPFGVIATTVAQRRLLAVRRTDRTELVVYEWAWHKS